MSGTEDAGTDSICSGGLVVSGIEQDEKPKPAESSEVQDSPQASTIDATAKSSSTAFTFAGSAMAEFPEMPETPSAGGGLPGVSEQVTEEDFSSEPLASRFGSKDLGRRCSAYTEAQAVMEAEEGSEKQAEVFDLFGRHLDTCLSESLPKGQDAALSALAVYLEKCPGIDQRGSDMLPLVRKLAEHKAIDKPKMQQLVPPVVLQVAELCECPIVLKELTDCLTDLENAKKKTQGFFKKQAAFIIKLIFHLLEEFGAHKMTPKLGYLGLVLKYISDSDRGIREACYSVLVELSAWMGDISEAVKSMDEPQKKELAKRLEGLKEEGKLERRVRRFYRGETPPSAGAAGASAQRPLDQFEIIEGVDALKKLPKGWCITKVVSMEKWKEKQEHLQILSSLLDEPRLQPNEGYSALVPTLQRMLKSESNIPVVTEAAKCMGLMAKGLRKEFEKPARLLLPVALSRINDKSVWKPNALIERVEQLLWALPFDFLLEELRVHISSKSLFVKKEALNLLLRALDLPQVQLTCPDAFHRFLQLVAAATLPLIDDSDNTVRQEAAKLLATLAFRNIDSAEVHAVIFDKLPSHRRVVFEDEWRKLTKEIPCPTQSAGNTSGTISIGPLDVETRPTSTSQAATRRPSPLRLRPPSPRPASPQRTASPGRGTVSNEAAAAPTVGRRSSPMRSRLAVVATPTNEDTGRRRTVAESPKSALAEMETPLMRQMAEEIRSLRSKVERMEMERLQASAATEPKVVHQHVASSSTSQPASRLRPASAGAGPHLTSEALREPHHARPSTPRRMREASTDGVRDSTPTRRRQPSAGLQQVGHRNSGASDACLVKSSSSSSLPVFADGGIVPFRIDLPKISKQARQQRERGQYWGPDQIPAEYLSALKDAWRQSVDERLWRQMFSDRMEEQLHALQSWRRQSLEYFHIIVEAEVLDLLLKWHTWMLFNSNTQVWKLILETFTAVLENLSALETQLTERETQILVPNIVERSGHNIVSIRETMSTILRQSLAVCPRLRILPMLLHGLTSKSKRSAACSMRAIGDALDRPTALALLRSQKDLTLLLKMTEDKDAELRKYAIHVIAIFSLHMDEDSFSRIIRNLPPATKTAVRAAGVKLAAGSQGASLNGSFEAEATTAPRRSGPVRASSLPERRQAAHVPDSSPVRASPRSRTPSASPSKPLLTTAPYSPRVTRAASPRPSPQAIPACLRHLASPISDLSAGVNLKEAPTRDLVARLSRFSVGGGLDEDFSNLCMLLSERAKFLSEADVPALVEALCSLMPVCFDPTGNRTNRCGPILAVLDELCASKDCVRSLAMDPLRRLLRELLRHLDNSTWAKNLSDGQLLLRKLNLSCVMLLNGLSRLTAYNLLFDLGLEDGEVISSSLIVKCLRKLTKSLPSSKSPEQEVQAVLDIVRHWLEKADRRSDRGGRQFAAVADGAKEVVEAALVTSPQAASEWARRLQGGQDMALLQAWLTGSSKESDKVQPQSQALTGPPSPCRARKSIS